MKFLLVLSWFWVTAAIAAPPNCTPVREATATVKIQKLYWEQNNGSWELKSVQVCQGKRNLDVLPGRAAGCRYNQILQCTVQLDGVDHNVNVESLVYHNSDSGNLSKYVVANYGVDLTPWQSNSVQAYVPPSQKEIGLILQGTNNVPKGNVATSDTLVIDVHVEDPNAP